MVVGQQVRDLEDVRSENVHPQSEVGEVTGTNEWLLAEVVGLKQRIEMLGQETQQLSEANKIVKRDISKVSECCPKVRKESTNLEHKFGKLKKERRAMRLKAEPFAAPGAHPDPATSPVLRSLASVMPAPAARKPASSSFYSILS
jgi:uncharacterized coiled-coil DUF342 family protein